MKNQALQKVVITNTTPKRKYNKKINVQLTEIKPEIILPESIEVNDRPFGACGLSCYNENIQTKRINNLVKAREARQEYINNKQSDKETKVNELVQSINNEQIEKIKIKNEKLKSKLLKLI